MPILVTLVLAVVDLAGTYFAVRAAGGTGWAWVAGIASFAALFVVLVRGLSWANLTWVMFGWVVLVSVGAAVMDHRVNGTVFPVGMWVGLGLALVGLGIASAFTPAAS